ncbi:MAG: hypothetical protein HC937_00805 [Aquincola sp.]|nr:hypothetical protein [Aquincola sp.]
MSPFLPILLAIAVVALVVVLTALARRLPVPTPILQVMAGLYWDIGEGGTPKKG